MENSNYSCDSNRPYHPNQVPSDHMWQPHPSQCPSSAKETPEVLNTALPRNPYISFQHKRQASNGYDPPGAHKIPPHAALHMAVRPAEEGRQGWRYPQNSNYQQVQGSYEKTVAVSPRRSRQAGGASKSRPGHQRVASVILSQSECCSSCSGGASCEEADCKPCDGEDCSINETKVVPCNKQSCVQPPCTNTCLGTGIQGQQVFTDYGIVQAGRLTKWLESPWNPQMPRCTSESVQGSLHEVVDPALQLLALSEAVLPTTPSMGDNFPTPYSHQGGLPANHDSELPSQQTNPNQPSNNLLGTGAMFDPATHQTKSFFDGSQHSDGSAMVQCAWDGCGQEVGYQDWFPHLHYTHIDPQMTFGCPIQADTCPANIGQNPVHHLLNDHGINFDMNGTGFSCPAPDCLPNETYLDPAMLHKHFDHAHAVPAWGSLQCRLPTCESTFQDPKMFFSHINEYHTLPPPSVHMKDDIDLNTPSEPAGFLPPTDSVELSMSGVPKDTDHPQGPVDEVNHRCQWRSKGILCGGDFDSEAALQTHVKEHLQGMSKSTGYICHWDGCEREKLGDKAGFSQRGKLERHMHSHTNYKDSRCDWPGCGQMFSAPQSLKQHYRRHTGEKPWKCEEPGCGKSFTQQSSLTCHMRKHTKNKPLICQTCGKVFSESTNLSKHRSKIHGETGKHACKWPGCEKTFHRISQLRTHAKEHRRKASISKPGVAMSESGSAVTGSEE